MHARKVQCSRFYIRRIIPLLVFLLLLHARYFLICGSSLNVLEYVFLTLLEFVSLIHQVRSGDETNKALVHPFYPWWKWLLRLETARYDRPRPGRHQKSY